MNYSKEDLIKYRMERALETYDEALELADKDHWNTVANRLYYCCFYLVLALFAKNEINSGSHSGAKILFHKNFIKTGILSTEFGKFYSNLFNKRQESDYEDFKVFEEQDIKPLIKDTESFIKSIRKLIEQ